MSTSTNKPSANIVWFEIPAENIERAKSFYGSLFGWNIEAFPGVKDYWHIDTGGGADSPDGGLMVRKCPEQAITNYINVDSVTRFSAKIGKAGGKICVPKTAVPQTGYFAICADPEGNTFGIWERNKNAK
jgi:uncharacterized protein